MGIVERIKGTARIARLFITSGAWFIDGVPVTASAAQLNAASGGGNSQTVTSGDYVTQPGDRFVFVRKTVGAPTQITLSVHGEVTTKDAKGDAATNNITVVGEAGETIDGAPSAVMNQNYQSLDLIWNGVEWSVL